jgi:hypothetical protein
MGLMLGLAPAGTAAIAQETLAEPLKQIRLTETQVTSFISAQADLAGISGEPQEAGDSPDAALQGELDASPEARVRDASEAQRRGPNISS